MVQGGLIRTIFKDDDQNMKSTPNRRDVLRALRTVRRFTDVDIVVESRREALACESRPWHVGFQRVIVGMRGHPELLLACIAHELGHCLSVQRGSHTKSSTYMLYRLCPAALGKRELKGVMAEENTAWELGFAFFKEHDLPVTKWMKRARKVLHSTHTKHIT